uniref:Putative phosphoenolpyruvate synthase n=1 Tax=Parasteatoda tepidariorum TaxID=114398 RepID=A0A2L2YDS1_PARTP
MVVGKLLFTDHKRTPLNVYVINSGYSSTSYVMTPRDDFFRLFFLNGRLFRKHLKRKNTIRSRLHILGCD